MRWGLGGICVCLLSASVVSPIRFREVARPAGLVFTLDNAATPEKRMIETMAGGVAVFDYNNDGRPDVFFTGAASCRLFRNEGDLKFSGVTAEARVAGGGYSMGAAAADFDNDGFVDLFVAGVNRNLLYRNLGNGRFEDVTARSGILSDRWAVAAAWLDYDRDGRLDLFVTHYSRWPPASDRYCGDKARGIRVYCHPKFFAGLPNRLYRNRGDGAFEDVSSKAGIAGVAGRGMSGAVGDYDGDGWPDVFVTNDHQPNFLFHNQGGGTFEEVGLLAAAGLLESGKPVASMGANFRDYDNDGWPDISVTALAGETFPLFRNGGKGAFTDATYESRLSAASLPHSGWGNGLFDFDNDGWKDLFTANSHVNDRIEAFEPHPYREANSVFWNRGGRAFEDVSEGAGFRGAVKAHRGCAFADFNGDGRIDVVVSALGEPAELWENVSATRNQWLIVKLDGYASSSYSGVHFGLGSAERTDIEVKWPSGIMQKVPGVAADQVVNIKEP